MCFRIIKRFLFGDTGPNQAALEAARRAAETAGDNEESVRRAQELRLRKLLASQGQGASFAGRIARAPVGVRTLLGT